jgi:uncharacterized protein YoxC
MVLLGLAIATLAVSIACLVFILITRFEHHTQFKETKATVGSFSNEMKQMRQAPPRLRTPYEERLKAEYEKRGMKWETTGK